MKREELTAIEAAKIINETAAALTPSPDSARELPDLARQITKKMREQDSAIQHLETLTAGLRDTCKLANEANRDLAEANRSLLAQLNAIRSSADVGAFLIVTDWTSATTFDEACRRAGQLAADKNNPSPVVVVARPAAICRTSHITTTDPAALAEWFID